MGSEEPGGPGWDEVVDELYGIDPDRFTARRDELAARARSSDRDLAARIKALRRPSVAAWAVNSFARHRPDDVDRLLALGDRLRAAHETLSAEQIRQLGRQRHQVVAALARDAAAVAADRGHPLSDASLREVESTLEAGLADPDAGRAVRAGRLVRALEHTGLGVEGPGVEGLGSVGALSGPVGAGRRDDAGRAPRNAGRPTGTVTGQAGDPSRQADDERRRRAERAEARHRALAEAEAEAAEAGEAERLAQAAAEEAATTEATAAERAAAAEREAQEIEERMQAARRRAAAAAEAHRAAARDAADARRAADQAGRRAERARGRRDALAEAADDDG